jgi:hypothetical protein
MSVCLQLDCANEGRIYNVKTAIYRLNFVETDTVDTNCEAMDSKIAIYVNNT